MNEKNTYTGSQVKNQFTAYLLGFVRGRRRDYLNKKIQVSNAEKSLEESTVIETGSSMEEVMELKLREEALLREADGTYLKWEELSDKRFVEALLVLREDERKVIYQHVFEERIFDQISLINGISSQWAKGIYYYAIRKIRKMMGGD